MQRVSDITVDHAVIQAWVEARRGSPAVCTSVTHGGGELRIAFPESEEPLQPISWKTFFNLFEEDKLAFEYEEDWDGTQEHDYYCFVPRREDPEVEEVVARTPNGRRADESYYDCYTTE